MSVLGNLEPKKVFNYFEEICRIPHGSYDTKKISDFLKGFAEDRGLKCYQDQANNIIIIKEATPGYENSAPVILQGHMDMVCEKTPESDIDFKKDGLKLMIDGDFVTADGTTLGGDNGIAVAMSLAILDSDDIPHPRLEIVITTDEEVGLLGAEALDVSPLTAKKFINIDSEEEGIFTASCAGGVTATNKIPVEREQFSGDRVEILIDGLLGGHSGIEIDKERASGNILMARVLYQLSKKVDFRIESLFGGQKDNAICKLAKATVVIDPKNIEIIKETVEEMSRIFKHEYRVTDSEVKVTCKLVDGDENYQLPTDKESTCKIITYLMNAPQGVQNMSKDIEGLVETSLNLGALTLEYEFLKATYAVRSSVSTKSDFLVNKLTSLGENLGGTIELFGAYPGWEYKADSPLRDTCVEVFKAMYGKEPEIAAIHAGLECGIFAGKIGNDLDCVSIGPDMAWVHTPDERLSISSTKRVWEFLLEVLKASK